jgi:hypothetical protein
MVSLLKSLHRFGKASRAAGRVIPAPTNSDIASSKEHSPPFCFIQTHSVVKAAFLLPLEVKKKTAGKNSQPFQEDVLQQRYPQLSYFSAALKPLKPED